MPSITIGSRRINYALVRGTGRRYTYLRFRPDMTLEIVVPRGLNVDVAQMLLEREEWIGRRMKQLSRSTSVFDGETLLHSGRQLKVVFEQTPGAEQLVPELERGVVTVRTSDRPRIAELVRRWFLKESSAYVVKKVPELAGKLGAKYSRVDVREMRDWGYCTRRGRLSFSWQLIALPESLREYVVLHELTHLGEFSHSQAFKQKLARACPDFRERERELNRVLPYDLGRRGVGADQQREEWAAR